MYLHNVEAFCTRKLSDEEAPRVRMLFFQRQLDVLFGKLNEYVDGVPLCLPGSGERCAVFPRVVGYFCDLPEARSVFGRVANLPPQCTCEWCDGDGDADFNVPVDGNADSSDSEEEAVGDASATAGRRSVGGGGSSSSTAAIGSQPPCRFVTQLFRQSGGVGCFDVGDVSSRDDWLAVERPQYARLFGTTVPSRLYAAEYFHVVSPHWMCGWWWFDYRCLRRLSFSAAMLW